MKYREIIFVYEPPHVELRTEVVKTLYLAMLFLSIFIYAYAYMVELTINNIVIPANPIRLKDIVGMYLLAIIAVSLVARLLLCKEKNDLFYWRIPGQLYMAGFVIAIQYLFFAMVYHIFFQQFLIILVSYLVGIVLMIFLMLLFIKKGLYSLDSKKNITGFYLFGLFPSFFGIISARVDFLSDAIKVMFPLYLLSILLFPAVLIAVSSLIWFKKFTREEIVSARLEKNARNYKTINEKNNLEKL